MVGAPVGDQPEVTGGGDRGRFSVTPKSASKKLDSPKVSLTPTLMSGTVG
ncbi:MAG: hypothetical protein ACOX1X_06155 [Dethiobacteria bacterium]